MDQLGKIIIATGLFLIVIGAAIWLLGNKLSWFGHLPGDIRIEKEGFRFYAPIASMLLLSIAVSFIIWLVRKFFS